MRILFATWGRKVFALDYTEAKIPQFTVWEDGSWYRSTGSERQCAGPMFGTPIREPREVSFG